MDTGDDGKACFWFIELIQTCLKLTLFKFSVYFLFQSGGRPLVLARRNFRASYPYFSLSIQVYMSLGKLFERRYFFYYIFIFPKSVELICLLVYLLQWRYKLLVAQHSDR